MKTLLLPTNLMSRAAAALLLIPAALRATELNFDDLLPGTVVSNQYPEAVFSGSPQAVFHSGAASKFNVLRGPAAGAVVLEFTETQSRVRLLAGLTGGTKSGTVTLRAYAGSKTSWTLVGTVSVLAGQETLQPLEICRVLGSDIGRIEIESSGSEMEIIDNLVFERITPAWVGTQNFDAVTPGEQIDSLFPGVQFLEPATVATAASFLTTTHTPTQVARPLSEAESHPDGMTFRLNPAQGAVRLRVGFPASTYSASNGTAIPLNVRVTAKNAAGVEIGRVERIYATPQGIHDAVEICRWGLNDIDTVTVHYTNRSLGGQECFDSLEFGPVNPGSLEDHTAPTVVLTSPSVADFSDTMLHLADSARTLSIHGVALEPYGLSRVRVVVENLETLAVTEERPVFINAGRPATYIAPLAPDYWSTVPLGTVPQLVPVPAGHDVYTFQTVLNLTPGRWRVTAYARDAAGNESGAAPAAVRTRALVPLGPTLYVSPAPRSAKRDFMRSVVLRRPYMALPELATDSNKTAAFTGTNFHRGTTFYLSARQNVSPELKVPPVGRDNYEIWSPGIHSDERTTRRGDVEPYVFDLAADGQTRWDLWAWDPWIRPGAREWTFIQEADVGPGYAELYGTGFVNPGDNSFGTGDFDCSYGRSLMLGGGRTGIRNPSRMLFLPLYALIFSNSSGHCYGLSQFSSLVKNHWLDPLNMNYPAEQVGGFTDIGSDTRDGGGLFELALPQSMWAHVQGYHGSQMSAEIISHIVGTYFGGGGPNGVLARIRSNPTNFILSMKDHSSGHVVAPYAVEDVSPTISNIYVYDSNHPWRALDADGHAFDNRLDSRTAHIRIDRAHNTFLFCLNNGTSCTGDTLWSGGSLIDIPMSRMRGSHSPPGIEHGLAYLISIMAGNATLNHHGSGGREAGVGSDGKMVENWPGGLLIPTTDGADGPALPQFLMTIPDTDSQCTAEVRLTGDRYVWQGCRDGVTVQIESTGGQNGQTDSLEIDRAASPLGGVNITSGGTGRSWLPRVGIESLDGSAVVFRPMGLDLRSGETLGLYPKPFSAASGDEGLEILNLTGRPQTFRLIVESGSPSSTTLDATGSGPFTLPAGGRERFLRLATGELRVMLDADNNGEPESNEPAVQTALYNGTVPAGADCNQNGIADALDIASGAFPDLNGNLVPDICEAVPPLPAMGIVGHSVKNGILTVNLSLEGTPGSRWMIQRSADLSKWTDVSSVTLGTSAVIQSVTEPDTSTRVYFRASFQP
jgi:hypothetical protein